MQVMTQPKSLKQSRGSGAFPTSIFPPARAAALMRVQLVRCRCRADSFSAPLAVYTNLLCFRLGGPRTRGSRARHHTESINARGALRGSPQDTSELLRPSRPAGPAVANLGRRSSESRGPPSGWRVMRLAVDHQHGFCPVQHVTRGGGARACLRMWTVRSARAQPPPGFFWFEAVRCP